MNFIRKIIEGKVDEATHRQFTRYGKGIYENKALIDITKTKNKVRIKTSFEFANGIYLNERKFIICFHLKLKNNKILNLMSN